MENVQSDRMEELLPDGRVIRRVGDVTVITTRTSNWYAASARVGYVERPLGGRGLRRRTPPNWPVPQGEVHAYERGSDVTACGQPLQGLHAWDDQPFSDRLLNRCRSCLERVRRD